MSTNDSKPPMYDAIHARIRNFTLVERLAIFALFAGNALILWHIPGMFGLLFGGGMFAFVGLLVVGEVWRQFQIRVLGVPKSRTAGDSE